jgi:hypothetical protein
MPENPYAAPRSRVEDVPTSLPDGTFIAEGRNVPAGRGWGWIAEAWGFMADQRWTFIGVFLLIFLIQIVAQLIPILGPLLVGLFYPVLIGGFVLGCDAVRQGQRLEVGHLFAGFQRHTGKLVGVGALALAFGILAGIIMVFIVGVSLLPALSGTQPTTPDEALGMLLPLLLAVLIVMALSIPLTMAMLFAIPLIVLNDSNVGSALKTSFMACLKNILPFLVWSLVMLGFSFLAAIPLFLGFLLLVPVSMVSLYIAYRDIFHDV